MAAYHLSSPGGRALARFATPLLLGLAACGQDLGPGPGLGPPTLLTVSGGGQSGTVGQALGQPLVARVTDAEGNPIGGVEVGFSSGGPDGGEFEPSRGTTDDQGEVASVWRLGTRPGTIEATVTANGLPPRDVSATALAGSAARLAFRTGPGPATAGVTLEPAIVVAIEDEFGNVVPTAAADVGVRLDPGALGGTTVARAVAGLATFEDLRIDQPGDAYVLRAEAEGLEATASAAFAVAPAPSPTPAEVSVTPGEAAIVVGQTAALSATVLDDQGAPIEGAPVTWTSSDPAVADVDAAGVVTGLAPGSADIAVEADGHRATAAISVSLAPGTLTGVTYCTIGGVEDLMDVYLPAASHRRPLPAVVHVHGGGWVSGSRSTGERFTDLKPRLLDRGFLVVSLDYRLAPAHKFPAQIQDVKCALRHLRANAVRYGLDPERIGAFGGSAGGQLVALLGTAGPEAGFDDVGGEPGVSSAVQAVVAMSAITDFTQPDELLDDYHRVFETWPDPTSPEMIAASPVTHAGAGDAPFFFIVGDEDALVLPDQSVRMHQRLRDAGVTSSLLRVLHAGHGLEPTGPEPLDPDSDAISRRIVNFFEERLR